MTNDVPIVPNGRGRCVQCSGPSNGNATCPTCRIGDGQCAPNCPGCVLDGIERAR